MKKHLKLIGLFALLTLGIFVLHACGGTSGASSPTTPAQVPTSIENYEVEFGSGEVIVTGVLPAGGISSISKSIDKVDATSVVVYGVKVDGTVVSALINTDDNRFYLNLPAGDIYSVVFAEDLTTAAYEDSETGLHSMPLFFLDGASSSGTAEFDADGALVSGSVDVVDVGTISYADTDISVGKATATGTNSLADQLNYGSTTLSGTATNDAGMTRFKNIDVDGNGTRDKAESKLYTFKLLYMSGSTATSSPMKPPDGTYAFTGDGNTYTFNGIKTLDIANSSTILNYVPFVIPKVIVSGGNITGINWKWMWKVSGTWRDMTIAEVRSSVVPNEDYSGYYFAADLGSGNYKYAGDTSATSGSLTFDTAVVLDSATYLFIQYKDIQGYSHGTTWRNFE